MGAVRVPSAARRLRARSRRRGRGSELWPGRGPVDPVGGHAARMMADALWVEKLGAAEAADAMRRPAEWVQGVVDGTVDPTLDELELAVNAIGLETRVSVDATGRSWPPVAHDREKLADKIARHRALDSEMYGEAWVQRGPPQPGATARLFSAGPGRSDGGGWAAVLTRNCLFDVGATAEQLACRAGIGAERARGLASGEWKPAAGEFERILASAGVRMAIRLEEYETHDDEHQARWEADPEGYEARIEATRREIQSWQPVQRTKTAATPTTS